MFIATLPQVCYVINMGLHVKLAANMYATYVTGVVGISNMADNAALYGTDDNDDNPFADLERIKRETSMLLLKMFLTSAAEDIPQFAFNYTHYRIKSSETCAVCAANATTPSGDQEENGEDGGTNDMLYLLKNAVMVRDLCLACAPTRAFVEL